MNRLIMIFCLGAMMLWTSTGVQAQATYAIDKGSSKISGTVSFASHGHDESNRINHLLIAPSYQVFVKPGFAVGGTVNFLYQSQSGYSENLLGLGTIFSYYLGSESSKFFPFVSGSYIANTEIGGSDYFIHNLRGSSGVAMMISRNVAISGEGYLQYNLYSYDGKSDPAGNVFGVLFGVSVFVF